MWTQMDATVAEIKLTKGAVALIDREDFMWVSWFKWSLISGNGYARRGDVVDGKRRSMYMHREIMRAQQGEYIDHINGNKLDNRKCNLRICTNSQNNFNKPKNKNNTSGYKGVFLSHNKSKPFMAQIVCNRKTIYLGYHATAEEAARRWDVEAKILHGEFARLNFPHE